MAEPIPQSGGSSQDPEGAPHEPVSEATLQGLKTTMQRMIGFKVRARTDKQGDRGRLSIEDGRIGIDFDGSAEAMGSGQVYDEATDTEYVVWQVAESDENDRLAVGDETFTPIGFVDILVSDPTDSEVSLERVVIPVKEGRVFEVDEGRYMEDDKPTTRELGDAETKRIIADMLQVQERI